jgi:hypothetical protein
MDELCAQTTTRKNCYFSLAWIFRDLLDCLLLFEEGRLCRVNALGKALSMPRAFCVSMGNLEICLLQTAGIWNMRYTLGSCVVCTKLFTYQPALVPMLEKGAICEGCFRIWNYMHRTSVGLEEIEADQNAYELRDPMRTYLFWTRTERYEAESQQVPYQWNGSFAEGERRLNLLNRSITSWSVYDGHYVPNLQDLNLATENQRN